MEGSNLKGLVDEEIRMKMGKAAGIGLAFGGVYGALNSMLHDGPQYDSNVKYPQLIRTTKRLVRWGALCLPVVSEFVMRFLEVSPYFEPAFVCEHRGPQPPCLHHSNQALLHPRWVLLMKRCW